MRNLTFTELVEQVRCGMFAYPTPENIEQMLYEGDSANDIAELQRAFQIVRSGGSDLDS